MTKITIATEKSDLHRLAYAAIKTSNSQKVSDVERCSDILRYLKKLNLSAKDLRHSKDILPLASLRDHENPKIRIEANELFNSWLKTLYSSGKNSSLCSKAIPMNLKKKPNVVKVRSELKSKKKNPRPDAQETEEIKQNLKKKPSLQVSENPKPSPALKKNSAEMLELLELFEIAKKSADVANAKGLLASTAETSICVDTLSLLISFPISSTATETRRIMERLERLTKHKDRKICNSATALLRHWRQSIKDQQQ